MMTNWETIQGIGTTEAHARLITESFRRLLGRALVEVGEGESVRDKLYDAPIVVLSHGTEEDPVLNYGNSAAQSLWERDWADFTSIPSRLTAEPMVRAERDQFLKKVAEQGFDDDFNGIRISSSGRRIAIERGIVWNLIDEQGVYRGQAAAFATYGYIE
ncbi:MEKHLA domain-containing protein [Paenibacillus sp. CCS19]|nr:MEKHLA domain-containing protein [Paenibacillus cellulosilyticus]